MCFYLASGVSSLIIVGLFSLAVFPYRMLFLKALFWLQEGWRRGIMGFLIKPSGSVGYGGVVLCKALYAVLRI